MMSCSPSLPAALSGCGGPVFIKALDMKNLELMGNERVLESVLREYAKKSSPDEMQAYLLSIPEPKLSLLVKAMRPEDIGRFEDWCRDPGALERFKAGPALEIDRMKEEGGYSPYELIRRFEELQEAVDREIMKYELWLTANPIAQPFSRQALAG